MHSTRIALKSRDSEEEDFDFFLQDCDGFLMNTIINFGDSLEKRVLSGAEEVAKKNDVCLCLGSTLRVTPACDLVEMGQEPVRLVICNRWVRKEVSIYRRFSSAWVRGREKASLTSLKRGLTSLCQMPKLPSAWEGEGRWKISSAEYETTNTRLCCGGEMHGAYCAYSVVEVRCMVHTALIQFQP